MTGTFPYIKKSKATARSVVSSESINLASVCISAKVTNRGHTVLIQLLCTHGH